jgi:putative PIN family toxin of toxin-antitoxin system
VRVTLDANVIVSGLSRRTTNAPTDVIDRWKQRDFDVFLSQHIVDRVEDAWGKPYFRSFLDDEEIQRILHEIDSLMAEVEPAEGIHGIAPDDEDDLILATAVAADADYLVTGDKGLLALGEFRGIPIVSPREFLVRLDAMERFDE